jgi:hypothetical protein
MNILFRYLWWGTILIAVVILGGCTTSVTNDQTDITTVDESGSTTIEQPVLNEALHQIPVGELNEADLESLRYMREEEKLAQDVYLTLYEQWGLPTFQNIANSEATHTEAVKTLLERYGVEDPAIDQHIGQFVAPTLQTLYDQLVVEGSQSLADALRVGAAIEEIDILDLEERIAGTGKADIQLVYQNLMKGSRNHLRAFTSTLERQTGETYSPQYLEPVTYEAIVSASVERGNGGQGQRGGGQGQSSGQNQGQGRGSN